MCELIEKNGFLFGTMKSSKESNTTMCMQYRYAAFEWKLAGAERSRHKNLFDVRFRVALMIVPATSPTSFQSRPLGDFSEESTRALKNDVCLTSILLPFFSL